MKRYLTFTLVSIAVALTAGALMTAEKGGKPGHHLRVTEVHIDFDTEVIGVTGDDFDFGSGPLLVSLGTLGDISSICMVDFTLPHRISCDFSGAGGLPSDGDYLLTVANGTGQSQSDQYDLTIVAGCACDPAPVCVGFLGSCTSDADCCVEMPNCVDTGLAAGGSPSGVLGCLGD